MNINILYFMAGAGAVLIGLVLFVIIGFFRVGQKSWGGFENEVIKSIQKDIENEVEIEEEIELKKDVENTKQS